MLDRPRSSTSEWCKQFVGEQLVTVRTKRGFSRLEWQKLQERNEALDCRVYARAAAWLIGAGRWPPSQWANLEAEFGQLEAAPTDRPVEYAGASSRQAVSPPPVHLVRGRRSPARRVRRSSWMA